MDKEKGSLYGFIVGDALGVPVEFMKREQLLNNPITEMIANKQRNTTPGYWSDDTAMSFCTMQSIIDKGEIDYKDIMDNFILWVEKGYMTAADVCFGIGQRTLKALTYYKRELKQIDISNKLDMEEWVKNVGLSSETSYETKTSGNGSLMRVLPAVLYLNKSQKTLSEKITIMRGLSSITHANEECKSSCIYYMILIDNLFKTNNIIVSLNLTSNYFIDNYDIKTCGQLYRIINKEFLNLSIDELKTTGYVIDTLETSLWCLYNTNSYEEAVLTAVNLGGDTDTIAAITGSLAGIYYGYDSIPKNWIDTLLKKDLVDSIINKFLDN